MSTAEAVERERASLKRVSRCADATWAKDPRDPFLLANQRIWSQHCHVFRTLQLSADLSRETISSGRCQLSDDHSGRVAHGEEGGAARGRARSVRDVIPESRLATYGIYYYDDDRERCYNSDAAGCGDGAYCVYSNETPDLMECWMLPQVEYWFNRLTEDGAKASRRRDNLTASSGHIERWDAAEEALGDRVRRARHLWPAGFAHCPPPPLLDASPPFKMRVRRRTTLRAPHCPRAPAPHPVYCPDSPRPLCDPGTHIRFDLPEPQKPSHAKRPRADPRLRVVARPPPMRAKCQPRPNVRGRSSDYRRTDTSRSRRPRSARTESGLPPIKSELEPAPICHKRGDPKHSLIERHEDNSSSNFDNTEETDNKSRSASPLKFPPIETLPVLTEATPDTSEEPTPVIAAPVKAPPLELPIINQKRLYSSVLSAGPPPPIVVTPVGRLRLPQGLVRLSSKLAFPAIQRKPQIDTKFEELEREALEQYKASDESIDSKFRALEKQAVDQYSGTSNSNTSCSSGQSASGQCSSGQSASRQCGAGQSTGEQSGCESTGRGECQSGSGRCGREKSSCQPGVEKSECDPYEDPDHEAFGSKTSCSDRDPKKTPTNSADDALTHSQNFPDLATRGCTSSSIDLKNDLAPSRGEKKEVNHRQGKSARCKPAQRTTSDTDDAVRAKPAPLRWSLHVIPPKQRNEQSSDEEEGRDSKTKTDSRDRARVAKEVKLSAHGGGDLHHAMRKTS